MNKTTKIIVKSYLPPLILFNLIFVTVLPKNIYFDIFTIAFDTLCIVTLYSIINKRK